MKLFFFVSLFWFIAWAVFLISVMTEKRGRQVHTRTLLDDIEVEL